MIISLEGVLEKLFLFFVNVNTWLKFLGALGRFSEGTQAQRTLGHLKDTQRALGHLGA